ncbi:hypothetical protein D9756_006515 [Leucocoprinus leucothites]|uniref:Replication factor A protein 3 n=1 Tax=Leucocoprinus leucothites TaxID=201217 RepID=A0A8H5G232_9AGAR|nr:hypothetical protein D9756_006515 [Leucoagaricus leucothites]
MAEHLSPRVNSKRLNDFVGKTVRLPCKVLSFNDGNTLTVEASDGGHVRVLLPNSPDIRDTFVEIIGSVSDSSSIKMMACINMGDKLDLKLANDVTEKTFDPRFKDMFFA